MNEFEERVLSYCEDITNGTINACIEHKWAVARFKRMYQKSKESDNYYYFDGEILEDFYWWAYEFQHVEGVLAGCPVELTDFQLFQGAAILCFIKYKNGARLVRKAYVQLGRKNAKSQFEAILGSFIAFIGDEKQRMYIAGWTRDQSSEVYEAVRDGISHSELLDGKWKETYGTIKVLKNKSVIIPLSKEARKTGDGKNPSVGIIDEYHAHETSEIYDVIDSGMSARKEPLLIIITTAGFNLNSPCVAEFDYVRKILDPELEVDNDEYFGLICKLDEGDDIKDESNWIKSNPILATYEAGIDSIRSALAIALEMDEKMRSLLTKVFNIWVDHKPKGYMKISKWNDCEISIEKAQEIGILDVDRNLDLSEWHIYLGTDLSMTTDLTSVGTVAVKNGKYFVMQHSFTPEAWFKERMAKDKVRYDLFRDRGLLDVTEGDVVDYRFVKKYASDFGKKHEVREHGFDKWNAGDYAQVLGEEQTMVEIPQATSQLSTPTKRFREVVYQGDVYHLGDELLKTAINNSVVKTDDQENIKISKEKSNSNGRIDPIAAVINAFARAMYDDFRIDLNERIMSDDFSF